MIREKLYRKTVDIIYQSYFNDTLRHSQCAACLVGNLVAANRGYRIVETYNKCLDRFDEPAVVLGWKDQNGIEVDSSWSDVFVTSLEEIEIKGEEQSVPIQEIREDEYYGDAKMQIDSTGYSWQELARMEFAFESAPAGNNSEDWMFNGLCAVMDVLAEIHQVDDKVSSSGKERLKTHYQQIR